MATKKRKSLQQLQREKLAKQKAAKAAKPAPKAVKPAQKALPPGKTAKALPPGKPGGPIVKPTPAKAQKALPPGKPGGALTKAVRGASGLRRGVGAALLTGMVAKAGDTLTKAANPKEWERVQRELKERQANYKAPTKAERTAGTRRNAAGTRKTTGGNNTKPAVSNIPASEGTGGKAETTLKYGSGASKPSQTTPSKQARTGGSNNTVSRAVTGKPAPKPAGKVPSSTAGMKNQDKNFRGNPNRKDSIASTLRELRGMGSGRKVSGVGPVASGGDYAKGVASSKSSKPEDKARYVAPDGRQYAGPAYGNGSKERNGNSNSSTYTAQSDGAKKLQEAQKERAAKAKRDAEERAKKARERLTASASKKPGSTYG